ncbi:unnamed protein product [Diabrotica balteata]|uniref:Aquaporin n=1 Tax=Diabrotica balteata TaxID=107213 RepID=A0A9N9SUD3_DIABA|nr:unnamed protein product [Diabrotica balteata]
MIADDSEHFPSPILMGLFIEILGMAIMIFLGFMGCVFNYEIGLSAFAFGLATLVVVQMLQASGPVHINPEMSLVF